MNKDSVTLFSKIALGVSEVFLTLGFLVAVAYLGPAIVSTFLSFVVAGLFLIVVAFLGLHFLSLIFDQINRFSRWVISQIKALRRDLAKANSKIKWILEEIRQPSPPAVTAAVLFASLYKIASDKVFHATEGDALALSLLLEILFIAAHKMFKNKKLWIKIVGWVVWASAILLLPAAVLIQYRGDIRVIISELLGVRAVDLTVIVAAFVIVCISPFIFRKPGATPAVAVR